MPEKPAHNLQAKAAGNEVRGIGVTIVVEAIVPETRLFGDAPPELLDALQRFVRRISGKQVLLSGASPIAHFSEQCQRGTR